MPMVKLDYQASKVFGILSVNPIQEIGMKKQFDVTNFNVRPECDLTDFDVMMRSFGAQGFKVLGKR